MKVALFGGTFDPFTVAHRDIVRSVLESELVDHVAVVPSVVDYYRDKNDRWLGHREKVRVIQRALADEIKAKKVTIDVNEFDRIESVPTAQVETFVAGRRFIHTLLDLLEGDYREHELYLIVGTDQYERFRTWFCWENILEHVKLIVVNGRGGKFAAEKDGVPVYAFVNIDPELANVSATHVRNVYRDMPDGFSRYVAGFGSETRKVLLHTPIFDVVQGPEVKPGFRPVQIRAPDWVMVLAERGGKFLMVTQVRYGNMLRTREFVCGKVEPGEYPWNAAVRELREETGVHLRDASSLKLIGTVNPNPASYSNRMWFYHVDLASASFVQESQDLDEHEEISISWVGKDEAFDPCRAQPPADKDHDVPAMYMCAAYLYGHLAKRNAAVK